MDIQSIISSIDHARLNPTATWEEIQNLCGEAQNFGTASVCVPACYVRDVKQYLGESPMTVCTVIGYPHGNSTIGAKLFEAKTAIMDGATEVDVVINLGHLKDGRFDKIFSEISGLKAMIGESNILKVIVETCYLTKEEKIRMCVLAEQAGADYIRTSTGFSEAGAVAADIQLFKTHAACLKIKAAGGSTTLEEAAEMLALGASRLEFGNILQCVKAREAALHME